MFKRLVSIVLSVAILTQLTVPVCAKNTDQIQGDSEYIIKYSEGSDYASVKEEFKSKKIRQFKKHKKLKADQYEVVTIDNAVSTEEYLSTITETDSVEYIVPDSAVSLFSGETAAITVSSEELLSSYLTFTETLEYKNDSPIVIAVADTGIDFDVVNHIYTNTAEKDNFEDDDNNSFTNDIHGWNFVNDHNQTDIDATHGTVVANIINRCIPEAVILPLVVADEATGTAKVSDIIDAIHYADEMGAQIMNCSWGSASYNYALKDAMATSDMLFVCAADNNSANITYPAEFGLDNVISVGNLDLENKADVRFSAANIPATGPNHEEGLYNGNSYATAFITSAIAYLYNAADHSYSAELFAEALKQTIYVSEDETRVFDFEKYYKAILSYAYENQYAEYLIDLENARGRAISNELKAILVNGFELLTNEDFTFLAEVCGINSEPSELQNLGCSLPEAVAVCVLASQLAIPNAVAIEHYRAVGNYKEYKQHILSLVELQQLLGYSDEAAGEYLRAMGNREIIDIAGAMLVSNIENLDFTKLNHSRNNTFDNINRTAATITSVNRESYFKLLLEYNLSQAGLDSYISENNLDTAALLADVQAWQQTNNFYLTDTNVYLQSTDTAEVQSVHNKYQMPSSSNIMDDVSVSDLYGMMTYSKNLISLSGKNGLDLDLSLRYDEDDALSNSEYADLDQYGSQYCAVYKVNVYWADDVGGEVVFSDWTEYGTPYTDPSLHQQMLQVSFWEEGKFFYHVIDQNQTQIVASDLGYSHVDGTRTPSFYEERYSLGPGWAFNFPALEDNRSGSAGKMVLHFSDGQKYTVNPTTLKLEGYTFQDITFSSVAAATFASGGRNSKWMITYKDGRRDFLDSTGRYIGSAGKNIGANTERIEVHYNTDGYVSEIIDTVGRKLTISYNIVEIVDEWSGEPEAHREIDIKFFDKNATSGTMLYKITQLPDWTMNCAIMCWLSIYDNNGSILQNIRYAYDLYDTDLWYNFRDSYIPDNEEDHIIHPSKSALLGSIYYTPNDQQQPSSATMIQYEPAYRAISDASVAKYARVKSVYTIAYDNILLEGPRNVIKNKQEYVYEVTGKSGTTTEFVMNAWNDINNFNDLVGDSEEYHSCVLYPKSTGYTYSVTLKETVDSNGNFYKATTNYYNDDRQLQKVCVYSLNTSGMKILRTQTETSYVSALHQKRTTRKYGSNGDGSELLSVYEVQYDNYANVVESHAYTGTAISSGAIQNIKKQEDIYRTFGTNKYIPLKEETIACDATGLDKAYRVVVENTIAPSGNDILKQRVYVENEYNGQFISSYKDTEYTYDSNFFHVIKEQCNTEGSYVDYKTTEYVYDDKYGIFTSEIISSSEIPNWEDYGLPAPEDVAHYYYEYDPYGRTVKCINGDASHTTTYTYDTLNALTSTTYPDASTAVNEVNYMNNTVITTGVDGSKIRYIYDYFGQIAEEYIFDGTQYRLSLKYEYDNNNRLIATYQYVNESADDYVKAMVDYDEFDRVIFKATVSKDGDLLSFEEYDYILELYNQIPCEKVVTTTHNGNKTSKTIQYFDSSGNMVAERSEYALNQYYTNTYTYGNYGHLISAQGDTIDSVSYVYDTQGNLITETFADNSTITYGYDGFSRLAYSCNQNNERTFYYYDAADRVIAKQTAFDSKMVDYGGTFYPEDIYAMTLYEYDLYGNLISESVQNNTVDTENENYSKKIYTYDNSDRLVMVQEQIDDNNSIYAQYYYDSAGRVLREYTGLTSPLTINGLDQVVAGADSEYSETKYTYDYRGNVASCTLPDGTIELYTYSFNNLLLQKKANGRPVVRYTYDSLGRLVRGFYSGIYERVYTYDGIGNLLKVKSPTDEINFTYDYLGNPLTETRTSTDDTADYVKTYTYSPRGVATYQLDLLNDSNIAETKYYQQYTYDSFGRIASTVQRDTATAPANYTIHYAYDPVGRLTSQTCVTPSLSTTKTMTYNAFGLVKSSNQTATNGSVNISEAYTYRLDGNMTEKNAAGLKTNYTYDNIGRLLQEETYNSDNTLTNRIGYGYDDRWNCISKIFSDYSSGDVVKTENLVYNKGNQLLSKTTTDSSTNTTDTYSYTYDNKGNCTGYTRNASSASPETVTYQYDRYNQFIGQQTNQMQDYTYTYDALGRRTTKTVGSGDSAVTTNHYWFGDTIVLDENAATNASASYVFGSGIVGMVHDGQEYVYGTNARHDVTAILGAEGTNAYTYDAYGNVVNSSETTLTTANPYRYGSYYYDEESGFYYLNARYYDAANARFTQRDTYLGEIHTPASRNLYTYAAGNPIYYTDPTGHFWETFFDVVSFGFSLYEAIKEPTLGNIASAVFDGLSIVVPFVAGTGLAKAGMKAVDAADNIYDTYKAVDRTVDTIDAVVDIGRRADKVHDALKISNAVDNASDLANSAKRGGKIFDKATTTTGKLSKYGDDAAAAAKKAQQAKNAANKANLAKSTKKLDVSSATKSLGKNRKADILAQNRSRGRAYEKEQFAIFSKNHTNAVEQVTIKTKSGYRTRVDAIGLDANGHVAIKEFKSSATAPLTSNQKNAFKEFLSSGGTVVGKGKGIFTNGYQIPVGLKVEVIRPR